MKLFISHTSPFARKVRIFSRVTGLAAHIEEIATTFESPELRALNPLGKIPALSDGTLTLFDSPLICEYLDEKFVEQGNSSLFHCGKNSYYAVQSGHALADGILDAAVATVMETRRNTEHSAYWLDRWQQAMETGVGEINLQVIDAGETMNIAAVTTAACLGYLDFRLHELGWRNWHPDLASWFEGVQQQSWFIDTAPPAS